MDFFELAKARYSCRKFTDEPVAPEQVEQILEAARSAPTAKNLQAYCLWVIESESGVERVRQATPCDFGAKTILALGASEADAWVRDADGRCFADVDAGIVGAHILFAVQQLGLGTTWVGRVDTEKFASLFPQTAGFAIVGLFPIGHPAPDGGPAPRHFERRALSETVGRL